ncbi:AraC family transcriptional regulator [Pedobacter sp. HMWF019]|uniref:GlxA family transcriptional regulator n=2 Tax=unclassified Pedobacter TaxID=2628915 RepID=UPI000D3CD326|nr:helix-turn-helix domain-containing protein [Pedobacter sp. HMWF019]PTT00973.1 AraC family transcriptional regulator [Pedobacter sp. HMWF019]
MIKVSVYVPESSVIESITPPYRVFNSANDFLLSMGQEPLFDVEFVGLTKHVKVLDGEYTVTVKRLLKDVEKTDLVIIPALFGDMATAVSRNHEAIPYIKELHGKGASVVSLCLGAFLLGATGLIDGKRCSTHWAYYNEFRNMYKDVQIVDGAIITDEGSIYSSGGANSIWNLLLYILEKYTNREMAILVAKFFAIDIDRDSQNAFAIFKGQKAHTDEAIQKAQEYIEQNIEERISIDELADLVAVSRRSFERRFKQATNNSVLEYIHRIKIEAAKRSFEKSRKNINEVMYDVGYTDTKAFRTTFKKITGLTPIAYRNKYNSMSVMAN